MQYSLDPRLQTDAAQDVVVPRKDALVAALLSRRPDQRLL
jgi:hypothetical protein